MSVSAIPASADEWRELLLDQGYCIIPNLLPAETLARLDSDLARDFARTPFGQGNFYGETTKRFGRLLARSSHAEALVRHPLVVEIVERLLTRWCDTVQLNVAQAIAVHPAAPQQVPHRDQEMWRVEPGAAEYLVNVIWPLTPFTPDNGATLVWPRSHGRHAASHDPEAEAVAAAMQPDSALLFLGSTLHGAGANRTGGVRRGIVIGYSAGWLKPYENQWLAYPPVIARHFTPELAALVGYRQHRPNLGNFEGQCPSILLRDGPDQPIGAVDALRPDQIEMVEAFAARQRAGR
ncbi:phytanoyl-CoA dioxygenase family protein [Sphingomonas sp. PL-96]|uniref:phytanoyl-CoA dioxygenase family protein n=1 Tax=Sphingomonas sp. PL-96 TaxID=2887201 RepID=UPI001E622FA9|nr:phytanoyl-CoA dioxygenase family protein [Sphingomonas sp. PL-96]MCC2977133.1 phytanoyl-CoA dioxygenase family protein [Sphingomonas sp. PL-96]